MTDNLTDAIQFPNLTSSPSVGQAYHDASSNKLYMYCAVSHGPTKSMWCYWRNRADTIVVADIFFDRTNLAGRFLEPWTGQKSAWVQVGGEIIAPEDRRIYIDNHADGRYERNTVDDIRFPKLKEDESGSEKTEEP